MANYNEQLMRAWDEWVAEVGTDAQDPNDFIDWAVANGKLTPRPEDLRKIYRRQVTSALRQVMRIDDEGTAYRAKQCVSIFENGTQRTLWFDVDDGGPRSFDTKQPIRGAKVSPMMFSGPSQMLIT